MDMQEHANMSEERTSILDYENGKYKLWKICASISVFDKNNQIEQFLYLD